MTTPEERERTQRELRELAELARAPAPPDSSGYVDLSAFSASDPNWVENALARSRGQGSSPDAPLASSAMINRETMGPVAMPSSSAFRLRRPVTRDHVILAALSAVGIACVAILAVGVPQRPPSRPQASGASAVQAPSPAPSPADPSGDPTPAPEPPPVALPVPAPRPTPAIPNLVASAASPGPIASAVHASARVAPAFTPSARLSAPPSKPPAGNDPLMNAMLRSIHTDTKSPTR